MKHYFILLILVISSCSDLGIYDATQYGDYYKHDKDSDTAFKRAGYTCDFAILKITNKTEIQQILIVNDSSYTVYPRRNICINIKPGYNDIVCQFDHIRLHAVPCNEYRHTIQHL